MNTLIILSLLVGLNGGNSPFEKQKFVTFQNYADQSMVIEIMDENKRIIKSVTLNPVKRKSTDELARLSKKDQRNYRNAVFCNESILYLPKDIKLKNLSYRIRYKCMCGETKLSKIRSLKKTNRIGDPWC